MQTLEYISGYVSGYLDAKAGKASSNPQDLGKIISKQTKPINLPCGNYYLNTTANLKYSINGSNSLLTLPQNCTNFKALSPNVMVSNFNCPKTGVFFEAAANHCGVQNCILGIGSPDGSVVQAFKTLPLGTNPVFSGNKVGVTQTVSCYIDQFGSYIANNVLNGSINEYVLRFEVGGPDGGTMQSGAIVLNNTIKASPLQSKSAVGIRWFQNVNFTVNTIVGGVRWGQVPGAGSPPTNSVGEWASGTMTSNNFLYNVAQVMSPIEVFEGVNLHITGNTITNPCGPTVSAGVFSNVYSKDNKTQIYKGNKIWEFFANSSQGTYIPLGGDEVVVIPAPK